MALNHCWLNVGPSSATLVPTFATLVSTVNARHNYTFLLRILCIYLYIYFFMVTTLYLLHATLCHKYHDLVTMLPFPTLQLDTSSYKAQTNNNLISLQAIEQGRRVYGLAMLLTNFSIV